MDSFLHPAYNTKKITCLISKHQGEVMISKNLLLASAACLSIGSASLIADECTVKSDDCVIECPTTQDCPCPQEKSCKINEQAIKAIEEAVEELDETMTKLLETRSLDGADNSKDLAQALTNQYQALMTVYKSSSESFSQSEKDQLDPLLKDVYAKVLKFQDKQDMIADLVNQTRTVLEQNN